MYRPHEKSNLNIDSQTSIRCSVDSEKRIYQLEDEVKSLKREKEDLGLKLQLLEVHQQQQNAQIDQVWQGVNSELVPPSDILPFAEPGGTDGLAELQAQIRQHDTCDPQSSTNSLQLYPGSNYNQAVISTLNTHPASVRITSANFHSRTRPSAEADKIEQMEEGVCSELASHEGTLATSSGLATLGQPSGAEASGGQEMESFMAIFTCLGTEPAVTQCLHIEQDSLGSELVRHEERLAGSWGPASPSELAECCHDLLLHNPLAGFVFARNSHGSKAIYDVCVNFNGIDVKSSFQEHLYCMLKNFGCRNFLNNHFLRPFIFFIKRIMRQIRRLQPELWRPKASAAKVQVVVVSKRYVGTVFGLNELVAMSRRTQLVIPVFYDVEPEHLMENVPFAAALKVEWADALQWLAGISGFHLGNYKGDESKLIQKVAEETKRLVQYSECWDIE